MTHSIHDFRVGDRVWLNQSDIHPGTVLAIGETSGKLKVKFDGWANDGDWYEADKFLFIHPVTQNVPKRSAIKIPKKYRDTLNNFRVVCAMCGEIGSRATAYNAIRTSREHKHNDICCIVNRAIGYVSRWPS
jgi:hypothetical protein